MDSRPVRSVCRLEHNKRRHRFYCVLESPVEKSRPMRSRQDPPKANSGIPHVGLPGPTRHRMTAASPNLKLTTALLGAILGNGKGSRQKQSKKECQKKRACAEGSCHRYVQGRK